jgi:hypothetical protein
MVGGRTTQKHFLVQTARQNEFVLKFFDRKIFITIAIVDQSGPLRSLSNLRHAAIGDRVRRAFAHSCNAVDRTSREVLLDCGLE